MEAWNKNIRIHLKKRFADMSTDRSFSVRTFFPSTRRLGALFLEIGVRLRSLFNSKFRSRCESWLKIDLGVLLMKVQSLIVALFRILLIYLFTDTAHLGACVGLRRYFSNGFFSIRLLSILPEPTINTNISFI